LDNYIASFRLSSHSGPVGKWKNLNYSLKVREDSTVRFTVASNQTVIGSIQMDPKWIASHPVNSEGIVELVTEILNTTKSSVGKLIILLFYHNRQTADESQSDDGQFCSYYPPAHADANLSNGLTMDYPSSSGYPMLSINSPFQSRDDMNNGPISANNSRLLFDRNLLSSPADSSLLQNGATKLSFQVEVTEIDLWDLKPMHSFSLISSAKNSPQVSLACGKVSLVSSVQENAGNSCYWTGLKWSFPVTDQATRLRLTVNSRKSPFGNINFTVDQLINALSEDENIKRVISFLFPLFCALF
jgi:hypothetical protein